MMALLSCSETAVEVSEQDKDVPVQKHGLEVHQQQLEKAKQVEKQLLEAAERKKKAIDDQQLQ